MFLYQIEKRLGEKKMEMDKILRALEESREESPGSKTLGVLLSPKTHGYLARIMFKHNVKSKKVAAKMAIAVGVRVLLSQEEMDFSDAE